MSHYLTAAQAAQRLGVVKSRICTLARTGRIKGAEKLGQAWLIPATFTVSPDPRIGRTRPAFGENPKPDAPHP